MSAVRKRWRIFWDRAPRQLKVQRDGRVILMIALASGFAAINTGNNLLFLGWGMVLASIVISGVLSEATLRILKLEVTPPLLGRVNESSSIALKLSNEATKSPAFATRYTIRLRHHQKQILVPGPFRLRVEASSKMDLHARFVPGTRGFYAVDYAEARTAYPFGFFEKIRRFSKNNNDSFWVAPERLSVSDLATSVYTRLGYSPARVPGLGEEFFSLRDFREGEDARGIHWRTSLRVGKPLVREHEAMAGNKVILELSVGRAQSRDTERDLALFCSVAESLLEQGLSVGILAPGFFIAPDTGSRQITQVLLGCAALDLTGDLPPYRVRADTAHLILGDDAGQAGAGQEFIALDFVEAASS